MQPTPTPQKKGEHGREKKIGRKQGNKKPFTQKSQNFFFTYKSDTWKQHIYP
jgi:hypothetical protein